MADERMKQAKSVGVILPTYCEAENIPDIITSIEGLGLNTKILVIDDSSPDGTERVVRQLQQKYEKHNSLKKAI